VRGMGGGWDAAAGCAWEDAGFVLGSLEGGDGVMPGVTVRGVRAGESVLGLGDVGEGCACEG
jgi:hypothetical protein